MFLTPQFPPLRRLRLALRHALAALFFVPLFAAAPGLAHAGADRSGAVYVMNNDAQGNAVLVFERAPDGALVASGSYRTGGRGTSGALESQGALRLSHDQRWLFAVNAGSNEISVFAVQPGGLRLVDKVASGGDVPISLTACRHLLYVLNAGGGGNITGFYLTPSGRLYRIPGSTRPLSNRGVGHAPTPAEISFSPDGRQLVVTERTSNLILTYAVGAFGLPSAPVAHRSSGEMPFGFEFTPGGALVVSESFGGAPGAGAVSSYALGRGGLQVISPSVPSHQSDTCWVAITGDGRYAYVTNTLSGSVTGYQVGRDGSLTLLSADGRTGDTGGKDSLPIDAAFSGGSRYLYVLNFGTHNVIAYEVGEDGSLLPVDEASVPANSVGIAAR
ncbi:MAG TPA: beta-propeller fold lactonase family protein [Polyangia bacterium]|jgi:6-phosphogluconolactonase (cycloisomerase 2 family)|nr:beta-propeller fold lactonase family protein [Polyangia bacterium]